MLSPQARLSTSELSSALNPITGAKPELLDSFHALRFLKGGVPGLCSAQGFLRKQPQSTYRTESRVGGGHQPNAPGLPAMVHCYCCAVPPTSVPVSVETRSNSVPLFTATVLKFMVGSPELCWGTICKVPVQSAFGVYVPVSGTEV
jgi:hypothetical protein